MAIGFIDRRKQRRPVPDFNQSTTPRQKTNVQAKNNQLDADALEEGRRRREIEERAEARELAALIRDPWQ